MKLLARYMVSLDKPEKPLIITDIGGPRCMTVTNNAEAVVEDLVSRGKLPPGRRLMYYDSEGELDEIVVHDGAFAGFKPGPGRA